MLPAELDDTPFTGLCCRDLPEQIALTRLGIPYIGLEQLHDRRAYAVCRCDQNRRNAHGLLKRVDRLREITARPGAADIGPMCEADRKRDDAAVDKDRPHHLDIVQMVSAKSTAIEDQHLPVVHVAHPQALSHLL